MSERLGLLQQREQSGRTRFDGGPVAHWVNGHNESLPPPPDKPKPPTPKPKAPTRGNRLSDEGALEIWTLHDAGHSLEEIRLIVRRSYPTMRRVLAEPRPSAPVPAVEPHQPAEKEKDAEAPPSILPMPYRAQPHQTTPDQTRPDRTSPRCVDAAKPTCGQRQQCQGEVRTFVLDWGRRMSGYEYSDIPVHCLPKKSRSRGKTCTSAQLQMLMRSNHAPTTATTINSRPRAISQSIPSLFTSA